MSCTKRSRAELRQIFAPRKSIVERDPEGLGIAVNSRTPSGLLIAPAPLVKEPSKTAGGLLYRGTVEFGALGVGGDKHAAKFREYKNLDIGPYLNNFTFMLERPKSAFHLDALGGGAAQHDQYYGVDVGRYNAWRVRGSFSEIPHVFTTTYKSLWDGVGRDVLTLRGLRPGGTTDANTTQANMRLAIASTPDSDLELTRKRSRARFDNLIPWALEPLTGGTINGVSSANVWNTTGSLSKQSADARIDTALADLAILLNPAPALSVKGKVRYFNTDNSTEFFACNPLTGQWGRLLNNGSGGSFMTPNLTVGNNPPGTQNTGYNGTGCNFAATRALGLAPNAGDVPIRSVPYEYRQLNSIVTAEYRANRSNSLEGTYERENLDRKYRDRNETAEDRIRLGYVNRALATGTLRISYEYGRRRGSDFLSVPLAEFYSTSVGPVPTANTTNMGTWLTDEEMRAVAEYLAGLK